MNKTELINQAEELLSKCYVCSVASVSEEGYPRICILAKLKSLGINEIWFSTGASGTKVRHFKSNNKAGVTFYDGGDSVTLIGSMEIIEDTLVKQNLWKDWEKFLCNHFESVDDPEYTILKFQAKEATIFVGGAFETVQL